MGSQNGDLLVFVPGWLVWHRVALGASDVARRR